jgi:hypothetical protein
LFGVGNMDHPVSINNLRSVVVRLNEILFSRFQLSGSAQDDSTPLSNTGASPRCVASRQNAETRGLVM